jgi:hypothetical protein
VTPIRVPPLPVTRFPAFREFAEAVKPEGWPRRKGSQSWTLAEAADAAMSVTYALGWPQVIAEDVEMRALSYWLSIVGSREWYDASLKIIKLPEEPIADSACFAWDSEVWGWDRSAWLPSPGCVEDLNCWGENALTEFYATHGCNSAPLKKQAVSRRPTFDLVCRRVEAALARGLAWAEYDVMTEEAMRAMFHPESPTARNTVRVVRQALRERRRQHRGF